MVQYFAVHHLTQSFSWLQAVVQAAGIRIGTSTLGGRITQAFSSAEPTTLLDYPPHTPHKLARFNWTTQGTTTDLEVYSPPGSKVPILAVRGLYNVPYLSIPILNTTYFGPVVDEFLSYYQTAVSKGAYDFTGTITGHVKNTLTYSGSVNLATFAKVETPSNQLNMEGGLVNLGFSILNGEQGLRSVPFTVT